LISYRRSHTNPRSQLCAPRLWISIGDFKVTCHNCRLDMAQAGYYGKNRVQRSKCQQMPKTAFSVGKAVQGRRSIVEGNGDQNPPLSSGRHLRTRLGAAVRRRAERPRRSHLPRYYNTSPARGGDLRLDVRNRVDQGASTDAPRAGLLANLRGLPEPGLGNARFHLR
jgi:hypothetical protein